MAAPTAEPMVRLTLTTSFDQQLLEIEGKSEATGRLYNGDFRGELAASLLEKLLPQIADHLRQKTAVPIKVDRSNYTILPDQ
ncbi:MAG: hypothetical protein HYX68_15135 [Planctomycetes bacterium]|jgi:hypothetical protein|nr:hypothetical protein [Planctomycetota bacterium]